MCTNLQLRVQLPFFTGFPFHPPFPDKKLRNTEEPISNYSKEQLKSMIWKSKIKMIFLKLSLRACNQNTACLSNKANAPLRASSTSRLRSRLRRREDTRVRANVLRASSGKNRGQNPPKTLLPRRREDTRVREEPLDCNHNTACLSNHANVPFVLLRAFETSW